MAKRKTTIPELWVVFDTNAIYTGSASYLFKKEVADLIEDNSAHPDLRIRWILPSVVRHERQYQMLRQAQGFLPTVEKLERLLGNSLNIPLDILELRVGEAVQRSIDSLKLQVEDVNVSALDWNRLILDSAYRRPPFDSGETEKGFRDAIVLETFVQLVDRAPQSTKSCRLAFVTGDVRLTEAATARTAASANVRLFTTTEELRGLINTLVSEVDEDFVKKVVPQASKIFFVEKEQETLYYDEKIADVIKARIVGDIGQLPAGAESHRITKFVIATPQFVSKERQQIQWSSRVTVRIEAIRRDPVKDLPISTATSQIVDPTLWQGSTFRDLTEDWRTRNPRLGAIWTPEPNPTSGDFVYSMVPGYLTTQTVGSGRVAYDVKWSTVINTSRKLTRPALKSIDFVDTVWG